MRGHCPLYVLRHYQLKMLANYSILWSGLYSDREGWIKFQCVTELIGYDSFSQSLAVCYWSMSQICLSVLTKAELSPLQENALIKLIPLKYIDLPLIPQ